MRETGSGKLPLNLLTLNSSPSMGGLERFQLELALKLAERGHTVEVAATPGSTFSRTAHNSGLPVHELRFNSYFSPLAILRLARLMRSRGIDVLHYRLSRNIWTVSPAARLAGLKGRIVHTLGMNPGGRLDNAVHRWLRGALGAFVAPTPETASKAARVWGMEPDEVTVIPNFVSASRFDEDGLEAEASSLRQSWGIPPGALVAGTLARLEPEKGIETFIRAARSVCRDPIGDGIYFIIGGPPSPEHDVWCGVLKASMKDAGLADRIIFAGRQDRVPAFMKALDLFVLPSHRETFGLVLVEAMLAGVAVLASHGPGPDFILERGKAGVLVPPRDAEVLSGTIFELLSDPDRRTELAAAGRSRALDRFSDEAVLPVYEDLFCRLRDSRQ